MEPTNHITIKDTIANPAPLGLFAFGLSTVLLNLHNAGVYDLNSMILAMGIFYGGLAQIIAGILEAKKNNVFGLTAFTSYGFFWLTLVGLIVMPKLGWVSAPSSTSMACYLAVWGFFTLLLFICTLRINRALQFVFATLVLLFALLAAGNATGNEIITRFAGYEGIICGLSAIYTAIAGLANEVYKRTVLPIGNIHS